MIVMFYLFYSQRLGLCSSKVHSNNPVIKGHSNFVDVNSVFILEFYFTLKKCKPSAIRMCADHTMPLMNKYLYFK